MKKAFYSDMDYNYNTWCVVLVLVRKKHKKINLWVEGLLHSWSEEGAVFCRSAKNQAISPKNPITQPVELLK